MFNELCDKPEAIRWYRLAVARGYAEADLPFWVPSVIPLSIEMQVQEEEEEKEAASEDPVKKR
jgi:hypothetical protein